MIPYLFGWTKQSPLSNYFVSVRIPNSSAKVEKDNDDNFRNEIKKIMIFSELIPKIS